MAQRIVSIETMRFLTDCVKLDIEGMWIKIAVNGSNMSLQRIVKVSASSGNFSIFLVRLCQPITRLR